MFQKKRFKEFCNHADMEDINRVSVRLRELIARKSTDLFLLAYCLNKRLGVDRKRYLPLWQSFLKWTGSTNGHGRYQSDYSPVYNLYFLKEDGMDIRFFINKRCFMRKYIRLVLEVCGSQSTHVLNGVRAKVLPDTNDGFIRYDINVRNDTSDAVMSFSLLLSGKSEVRILEQRLEGQVELFKSTFTI